MSEKEKGATVDLGDETTMTVFDRKVNLPEKVVVVDAKNGKEIGFIEREKVMKLLEKDGRYEGFEDGVTGKFMLAYNSDGDKIKTIHLETEDVFKFLETVWRNLETALGADDPKTRMLGVSYEVKGKAYVMSISLTQFVGAMKFLHPDVVDAIRGDIPSDTPSPGEMTSPTDRLIDVFKKWPKEAKV
jgi:hypothetical protein